MNLALNPYLPRYSNKQASPQICHHPRNITRSIPSKTQKSSLSPHPEVITDLRFLPFEQRDFCFLSRNQHFYMYVPLGVVCSFFGEKLWYSRGVVNEMLWVVIFWTSFSGIKDWDFNFTPESEARLATFTRWLVGWTSTWFFWIYQGVLGTWEDMVESDVYGGCMAKRKGGGWLFRSVWYGKSRGTGGRVSFLMILLELEDERRSLCETLEDVNMTFSFYYY